MTTCARCGGSGCYECNSQRAYRELMVYGETSLSILPKRDPHIMQLMATVLQLGKATAVRTAIEEYHRAHVRDAIDAYERRLRAEKNL